MLNAPAAPTYQSGTQSVAPNGTASPQEARAAALQFLGQLATELSCGTVDLPCFPDVVLRIRKALDDPKNTPGKTVTVSPGVTLPSSAEEPTLLFLPQVSRVS